MDRSMWRQRISSTWRANWAPNCESGKSCEAPARRPSVPSVAVRRHSAVSSARFRRKVTEIIGQVVAASLIYTELEGFMRRAPVLIALGMASVLAFTVAPASAQHRGGGGGGGRAAGGGGHMGGGMAAPRGSFGGGGFGVRGGSVGGGSFGRVG